MNCGVDYEDGYWAEPPANMKRTSALKNSKSGPQAPMLQRRSVLGKVDL